MVTNTVGPKRSPATNAVAGAFLGWPPGSIVKIVTGKRANVTQFHRQGYVVSGSCGDELALIFTIMEFAVMERCVAYNLYQVYDGVFMLQ